MTTSAPPVLTKKQLEILSKMESVVNTLSLRISVLEREISKLKTRDVALQP